MSNGSVKQQLRGIVFQSKHTQRIRESVSFVCGCMIEIEHHFHLIVQWTVDAGATRHTHQQTRDC